MLPERQHLALGSILAALLVSCSFESKGVDDLVNQGATYVNFPGKRWLAGNYSRYAFDGVHLVGTASWPSEELVGLRNDNELVIAREAGGSCSAGSATRFVTFWRPDYRLRVERPAVVAFLSEEDRNGRGKLSFASVDCDVWSTGLEHAELPIFLAGNAYLVRDQRGADDALVVVDPWQRTLSDLTPAVTQAHQTYAGDLYTLEAGNLIRRDLDLNAATLASDVTAFLPLGNADIAFTTATSVSVRSPQRVDWDLTNIQPCAFRAPEPSEYGFGFSLWLNCPPNQIDTLLAFEDGPYRANFLFVPEASEKTYVSLPYLTTQSDFFALTPNATLPDGREIGALWWAPAGASAETAIMHKLGESSPLPLRSGPGFSYAAEPGVTRLLLEITDGLGRLVDFQAGDRSQREVTTRVADFDGSLAIRAPESGGSQLLAAYLVQPVALLDNVASLDAVHWVNLNGQDGLLVVTDEQAGGGRLLYAAASYDSWRQSPPQVHFDVIDDNVVRASVRYFDFGAVGYLRDVDPASGTGTLRVHFVDSKDTFEQKGVSRFEQSAVSDGPGVLYNVPVGADAGVWFARAK